MEVDDTLSVSQRVLVRMHIWDNQVSLIHFGLHALASLLLGLDSRCLGSLSIEASDSITIAERSSEVRLRCGSWSEAARQTLLFSLLRRGLLRLLRAELQVVGSWRLLGAAKTWIEASRQFLLARGCSSACTWSAWRKLRGCRLSGRRQPRDGGIKSFHFLEASFEQAFHLERHSANDTPNVVIEHFVDLSQHAEGVFAHGSVLAIDQLGNDLDLGLAEGDRAEHFEEACDFIEGLAC
mmetsp:Transcript_15875/g.20003  ORF Transcript_15875/g.20003 Transcript_15875/m.20003 type:complete len:238 (-) Transcript_15875:4334-5047(-)